MTADPNKKTPRTFQCRDSLWLKFEQMARELECSIDYLINDAMKQYARQRGYTSTSAAAPMPAGAVPPPTPGTGKRPSAPPPLPLPARPLSPPPPAGASLPPLAPPGHPAPPPPLHLAPPAPGGSPMPPPPPTPSMRRTGSHGALPAPSLPPPPGGPQTIRLAPPPPVGGRPLAPAPPAPLSPRGAPPAPPPAPPGGGYSAPGQLSIYYSGERFSVNKDRFIIGRGKQSSDLTIKDPNVSRQHAMVEFLNGQYYIVDMGSTNGVEYAGQRVQRKVINEGDVFKVCDHELRFSFH